VTAAFLPSVHGLHFDNRWPAGTPVLLGLGDAGNGLCGGMVFAAADLHRAGLPPPDDRDPPAPGTPLFRYLVRRQWDSVRVLAYYRRAVLPDPLPVRRALPRIVAALDRGRPVPLGLVTVRSFNPLRLVRCHQVLAYGHHGDVLRVYDPNQPDDDTVTITVDGAGPVVASTVDCDPIRGLFSMAYRYRDPTAALP
jgi:hypothetical protein